MKASERIRIIEEAVPRLSAREPEDVFFILRQCGLESYENRSEDLEWNIKVELSEANDFVLEELADYLFGSDEASDARGAGPEPDPEDSKLWKPGRFRLFMSHVHSQKVFISDVKNELGYYGVDAFVAHEDIIPTHEWLTEIELALETCDALAAFLSTDFHGSLYTDQEVGFAVAQRVLVVPIKMGIDPYGFIARYQALQGDGRNPKQLAWEINGVLADNPLTSTRIAAAMVTNFTQSQSHQEAQTNWRGIQARLRAPTPEQLRALEASVQENDQISGAYYLPDKVRDFVREHSGRQATEK